MTVRILRPLHVMYPFGPQESVLRLHCRDARGLRPYDLEHTPSSTVPTSRGSPQAGEAHQDTIKNNPVPTTRARARVCDLKHKNKRDLHLEAPVTCGGRGFRVSYNKSKIARQTRAPIQLQSATISYNMIDTLVAFVLFDRRDVPRQSIETPSVPPPSGGLSGAPAAQSERALPSLPT